jgi:hypothetical protein
MKKLITLTIVLLNFTFTSVFAQGDIKEDIGMIKKNLSDSKNKMKTYEWIETTVVFVDGEQKSTIQKQCYYAVDGKLTKIETGGSTQSKTPGGVRGKIAKNKKEDMVEYAQAAAAKVHTYLPPNPEKIQSIFNAGKVNIQILEPQKKFKLNFPDYNEAGDILAISLDKSNQKLMAIDVTTTVEDPKEKLTFNATLGNLPDGTQYTEKVTLNAPEKDLKIVITNSGYKHSAGK